MEGEEVDRVVLPPILKSEGGGTGTVPLGLLGSGGATQKAV